METVILDVVEGHGWKWEKARTNDIKGLTGGLVDTIGKPLMQHLMESGYASQALEDSNWDELLNEFIEKGTPEE